MNAELEIAQSSGPYWLEIIYWISQIFLTLIAGVTAWFAYDQLVALKHNRDQELRISHANLILSLDHRWDNELAAARSAFKKAQEEIKKSILDKDPRVGGTEKAKRTREKWTEMLRRIRDTDPDQYRQFMSICGFFETVGMMVRQKYIDEAAVINLFEGSIVAVDECFRGHIDQRAAEDGVPKGFLEHTIYLCDLCKKLPPR